MTSPPIHAAPGAFPSFRSLDEPPSGDARFVEHAGVQIHYVDFRPARDDTDAPLVFLPGMTCVADDYHAVLSDFGRRVIVIDLRGRGRSDTPDTGYAADDHIADIEAVLDDAGVGDLHLATFSRGTAYGLGWAVRHGERVRSVAIGDYIVGEIALASFAPEFVNGRWRGTPVLARVREHTLQAVARESVQREFYDEVAQLDVPVLLMRSGLARSDSPFGSDEVASKLLTAAPHAEITVFDESPHDLFKPDPKRFPLAVRRLMGRADATRRS